MVAALWIPSELMSSGGLLARIRPFCPFVFAFAKCNAPWVRALGSKSRMSGRRDVPTRPESIRQHLSIQLPPHLASPPHSPPSYAVVTNRSSHLRKRGTLGSRGSSADSSHPHLPAQTAPTWLVSFTASRWSGSALESHHRFRKDCDVYGEIPS